MTIKLRSLLEENNILVPRNIDSRKEQQKRIDYQRIQEYIKNGSQGDLDLERTPLTKLPDNLTRVGEALIIQDSSIEDLNNLEYIGGYLNAYHSKLKSIPPKLIKIGGTLFLDYCPVNNIDNLKYVRDDLWIPGTYINELPKGLRVEGSLYCRNTPLAKRFPNKSLFEEYIKERNIIVEEGIFSEGMFLI